MRPPCRYEGVLETRGRLRFSPFDALPQGVAVVCESGQVLFWNRWLESWSGVSRARALSQPLAESLPQLAPLLAEPLSRALQGERSAPLRCGLLPPGGEPGAAESALRVRVEPMDAYDVRRCAVLTLEDLGDWLRAEAKSAQGAADFEAELARLRARVAAQDAQLRRQTEALLRHARELSLASAALDEALARCEAEPIEAPAGAPEREVAGALPAEAAAAAEPKPPWASPL